MQGGFTVLYSTYVWFGLFCPERVRRDGTLYCTVNSAGTEGRNLNLWERGREAPGGGERWLVGVRERMREVRGATGGVRPSTQTHRQHTSIMHCDKVTENSR